jgi:methylenetetrahydrofolate reductase (NADPH)
MTLGKLWPFGKSKGDAASSPAMRDLVRDVHFEIVPMKSIDEAIAALPPGALVSVTCSPAKGIGATQQYTEQLLELGHRPTPHISARLVESEVHAKQIATWLREQRVQEVFVIAGDATEPSGPYQGALPFMRDLLEADPGVERIGFTGYPDGHAFIDSSELTEQLHAKHALLAEAGVGGWISTQMCFDEQRIHDWLQRERAAGITLPVRLGIPGVVDRTRLMKMGTRLGVGTSLRYLSKNRSTVMKLMAPGGYDPTDLVVAFADDAPELGIEALHSFTFNAVADTRKWQEAILAG